MSAPDLSAEERAVVQRFEAAEPAPESLRERAVRALYVALAVHREIDEDHWDELHDWQRVVYYRQADAAIAVMRGEQ